MTTILTAHTKGAYLTMNADDSLLSLLRLKKNKEGLMAAKENFNETKTSIYPEVADQHLTRASANQWHGNGETSIATT